MVPVLMIRTFENLFRALESQTYPKNLYDVIVVNASDEDIESVVSQFGQALTTHESRPAHMRAPGTRGFLWLKVTSSLLLMPIVFGSDWIEKGVANLLRVSNCGLVAGKVEVFFNNPNQLTAVELYDSVTFLSTAEICWKKEIYATANFLH